MLVDIHTTTPPAPPDAGFGAPSGPVAFVLSGGASLGAIQVGMLKALYEQGISPDFMVGTSAGALNAAFIATRPQTVQTAHRLAEIWRGLRREDLFPINPRILVGGLANHRDHLVPDSGIRRVVQRHLQIDRLEESPVPLHLVSFDLLAGEEVRLSTGSAFEAVLAATAIPGVLPSVRRGRQLLVDGGIVNNTPISHAIELGARQIYVLEAFDPQDRALSEAPRGALDAAVHSFAMLVGSRERVDLQIYADAAELIILPARNPDHIQPTDFEHADELMSLGLREARRVLSAVEHPAAVAA